MRPFWNSFMWAPAARITVISNLACQCLRHVFCAILYPILLTFIITACNSCTSSRETVVVIGRVENVVLQDVGIKVKARIDTGAGVSSIDAKIIEVRKAERGEGEQVVFQVKDDDGGTKTIERRIVEWVEIKGKGTKSTLRRPVVILDLCLGGKWLEGRVNLADRSKFIYPVLVGRNLLKAGDFHIDPRRKFMTEPKCG